MPGRARWLPSVLTMVAAVGLAAMGCGGSQGGTVDQEARDQIKVINDYLGTPGGDPTKSLLANIEKNNEYLRQVITDLKCQIWLSKQPAGTPQPSPCPPGEGPSTRPTTVPGYPP